VTRTPLRSTETSVPQSATPSNGLLLNGGFEAVENEKLLGWKTYGGEAARVDRPVHTGNYAGAFSSSTESTKWLYQPLIVKAEAWYTFSAHVYANDPEVEGALLRVSWYQSEDGTGSALSSVDSTESLTEPQDGFRHLTTTSVQAPGDARSAKARIVVRPRAAAEATVFVDDAWFVESDPAPPGEEPATNNTSSDDPDGPTTRAQVATRSGGGLSQASVPPAQQGDLQPQPSPVVRRSLALGITQVSDDRPQGDDWWYWLVPVGAAAAICAVSLGAWWKGRRKS